MDAHNHVDAQTYDPTVLNVRLETAVRGYVVADASTGIDVTTTTTPPKLVPTKGTLVAPRVHNHGAHKTRTNLFRDLLDSNLLYRRIYAHITV